jgi:uncharacterized protein with HEPN domain
MSERDIQLLLQDIIDAIGYIKEFVIDIPFDKYQTDLKTKHAVERNFSIIGKAVARIDKPFRDLHPTIDWRQIKDFRNFIVHDYFGIDDMIVWDIIHLNLDQLKTDILAVIESVPNEQ